MMNVTSRNPCWQGMPHEACEGSELETTSGAQHHIFTWRHKQVLLILPPSWEWEKKSCNRNHHNCWHLWATPTTPPCIHYTDHGLHGPELMPGSWVLPVGKADGIKSQCSAGLLVIDWCLFRFSTFRGSVPLILECNQILIICLHTM